MNILIVDDHPGCRALIRRLIARPGDRVCECGAGEMAVPLLAEFKPDWAAVDLVLPVMNGLAVIKAIRSAHPSSRIVMVSGYDDPGCGAMAAALGAEAFVSKTELVRLRDLFGGRARPPAPATLKT